jgi:hypothetical protein
MSKIWLTWLQPSLGVLGTALVLSNPLCSSAAPNSGTTASTKVPAPYPSWSGLKSTGTNIDRLGGALRDRQLLKGIAASPDQAVRQLAIDTMANSGKQPSVATAKGPQNFDPLASFTGAPVRFQQLSAKAKKPVQINQSIATALSPTTKAKTKVLVPGLAIGTADVRVSSQVLPTFKPATAVATARVSTPVQLAAMVSDKTDKVATPFPVVRPELMQKLEANPIVASSVADVKTASRDLRSIGLPKVVDRISINPVASIPNGLQQLLGNNIDGSIKVSVVPVSKATGPNFRSMAALTKLVSPSELVAPASVTTASLRLATAQSYTNVVKFSIPGETIAPGKPTPVANVVTARVQKNLTTATSGRKSNYASLMTARGSISAIGQSWISVSQSSNLGGLILGSQQLATLPKVVSLLTTNATKFSSFTGSTVSDLGNIN